MAKTFYTIDDLYNFCKENHFEKFSSAEKGAPLIVQSFGTFESDDSTVDGLKPVKLKSCHTGKNRNKSGISDETMDTYKNSFMGKPILGAIYKTDTGEYEFRGHDMELVENGDDVEINYIEQPIGVISQTVEPYLQYDEKMDKNYLMVEGTIFTDYSKAGEILERRKTCKCSVEIAVEEMSYDCKEDYLSIDKFHFCGVTILGYQQDGVTEIQEGMEGSKITIDDFSESNSMFATNVDYTQKLVETLEKLNSTLSSFQNTNIQKEGGTKMDNFENTAVVEEEVKTSEEATEETVEEITNEETSTSEDNEVVETEACGGKKKKCSEDEESEEDEEPEEEESEVKEQEACGGKKKKCSIDENGNMSISFEVSHEDIACALYNLIQVYDEEDNEYYFIREVFDNYFLMQGWYHNRIFKQEYSVENDNVSIVGERQEMFELIVSESEKIAIEKMRTDYAELESKYNELKAFKDNYDAVELKAQKDEVFANASYEVLADNEAFEELKKNAENFSLEEVTTKAKLIFADYVQSAGSFSTKKVEAEQAHKIGFNFNAEPEEEYAPYGNILPAKKRKKK